MYLTYRIFLFFRKSKGILNIQLIYNCSENSEFPPVNHESISRQYCALCELQEHAIVFAPGSDPSLSTAILKYTSAPAKRSTWYSLHIHSKPNCIRNTQRFSWPKYVLAAENYGDSQYVISFVRHCRFQKQTTKIWSLLWQFPHHCCLLCKRQCLTKLITDSESS